MIIIIIILVKNCRWSSKIPVMYKVKPENNNTWATPLTLTDIQPTQTSISYKTKTRKLSLDFSKKIKYYK